MMALWPDKFWMKLPSGNFHCFMLSAEPEANVYLTEKEEKLVMFLWCLTFTVFIIKNLSNLNSLFITLLFPQLSVD